MQSKLFILLFFIIIFSLTTFSSNENENKNKKRNRENTHVEFQNTLNFVESSDQDDNLQNYPLQNDDTANINVSNLYRTKQKENFKIPFNVLKTQEETENPYFDLISKTHKETKISTTPYQLLNLTPSIFSIIFSYLSLFELELHFVHVASQLYQLYETYLEKEKFLLNKENLNNKQNFCANINHPREYFDFFEKRHWSKPERIEYANVDSFSKNLILFPKSIRQIICFTFNKIKFKYILFKNGDLSILKKLETEEKFVLTSLENDFDFKSLILYPFSNNIRWVEFVDEISICKLTTTQTQQQITVVRIILHKTENLYQEIEHKTSHQKIIIYKPISQERILLVFFKNLTGFLKLYKDNGLVKRTRFEISNKTYKKGFAYEFMENVKKIKSNDFEHYIHMAKEIEFVLNN